jgi:tetratricopeptide (TPR) repeat protein
VTGRPLVNVTFAVNYAIGGFAPTGYHAVNLAIHFLSALLVFAIVRRTLGLPHFGARYSTSADWLALAVAMVWALHPLLTATVIYASQRTELMMAMFYLATLYFAQRYWAASPQPVETKPAVKQPPQDVDSRSKTSLKNEQATFGRAMWLILAVVACACGMASKEVMVSAPIVVLLFERSFVAGTLASALRRSWPLYIGLASTWILLLALNIGAPRGTTAGFGLGVSGYEWWLTQSKILLMYLKLVVWPWPLLIHYQFPYLASMSKAWMFVIPVLLLGIGTLVLLWRNHAVGFLGTWIFAILSPTLLIPIVTEMADERRMYLPLVALIVLLIIGGYRLAQATADRGTLVLAPAFSLAIVCGLIGAVRLKAYDDEIGLWREVVRFQPQNAIAHANLGGFLNDAGQFDEAAKELRAALELRPDLATAHSNLGILLGRTGNVAQSIEHLQEAIRIEPDFAEAHANLAQALVLANRPHEAIAAANEAINLARSSGRGELVKIVESWLAHYQRWLQQNGRSVSPAENK